MFGIVLEDGVECKVVEMAMFLSLVVVVVDEILYIVMRPDIFYVLKQHKNYNFLPTVRIM